MTKGNGILHSKGREQAQPVQLEQELAKSPGKLGADLQRVLEKNGIAYTQHEDSRFACRKQGVHFHLEITNTGSTGVHKVRGKKVLGCSIRDLLRNKDASNSSKQLTTGHE